MNLTKGSGELGCSQPFPSVSRCFLVYVVVSANPLVVFAFSN